MASTICNNVFLLQGLLDGEKNEDIMLLSLFRERGEISKRTVYIYYCKRVKEILMLQGVSFVWTGIWRPMVNGILRRLCRIRFKAVSYFSKYFVHATS